MSEHSFRVAITSPDEVKMNAVFLEVEYDEDSFAKFFEPLNHNTFKVDGDVLPKKKGEHQLPSVKVN